MENNTSVIINLFEGTISLSGTAEFVEKTMPTVFEFVEKNLSAPQKGKRTSAPIELDSINDSVMDEAETKRDTSNTHDEKEKYLKAGIYHIDAEDGEISILQKIPGANKSEKAKNIALIVLYIKGGKIQGKELIPLCEKHACFDSANFASTFKNELTNFVRKGSGQSWTLELTQPGEDAAKALLEEMINDKK
jgi:hypothetical protein